jgi:hypothetical protein
MSGAPSRRCPECGREVASERRLYRTHRRWRWAAAGLLIAILGHACRLVPVVQREGWWGAAPRLVLIAAMPYLDNAGSMAVPVRPTNPLLGQLVGRFHPESFDPGNFYPWERWLLRPICRSVLAGTGSDGSRAVAAMFYVTVREDAIESVPESCRAPVIIATTARVYGRCSTCRCTGAVSEGRFLIAFERSTRNFRFEFLGTDPMTMRYVIWRDEAGVHQWWTVEPKIQDSTDLDQALGGAYGVCHRASGVVPELLLPKVTSGVGITDLVHTVVAGVEEKDGRRRSASSTPSRTAPRRAA